MKSMFSFLMVLTLSTLCAQETPAPAVQPASAPAGAGANRNPINVVAVGYDIENNPQAQKMLQDMGAAARAGGATGEIIMAGKDEAALDQAMEQAMSIATRSSAPGIKMEIKTTTVHAGGKIVVVHSEFNIEDKNAWIAFYEKAGDRDEEYLSYTFLRNLTDRTHDVVAPEKPGDEYHFRLFKTQAYDCAARSGNITVK